MLMIKKTARNNPEKLRRKLLDQPSALATTTCNAVRKATTRKDKTIKGFINGHDHDSNLF